MDAAVDVYFAGWPLLLQLQFNLNTVETEVDVGVEVLSVDQKLCREICVTSVVRCI